MHDARSWGTAVALAGSMLASPVGAQVSTGDSGKGGSHLALHVPFFIPFFHHRHQAGRALSAEADSTALLRLEAGYDGNFRSPELARDESSTINLDVTPTSRIELQADIDFWAYEAARDTAAVHGRGDMHVRAQWTAFTIHPGHVAVAIAYVAKLPTANRPTLGTGRVDHRVLVPISFAIRGLQVDGYAGADANGTESGLAWGPEGGVGLTVGLGSRFTAHAGVSSQSLDTDQPKGRYLSGGISCQLGPLVTLDLGGRLGVSPGTPSYGLTAGITTVFITR